MQVHQTIISAAHCLIGLMICGLSHLREQFAKVKLQREISLPRAKTLWEEHPEEDALFPDNFVCLTLIFFLSLF